MRNARSGSRFGLVLLLLALSRLAPAQTLSTRPEQAPAPAAPANSDPTYQQLRNVGLSGEVAAANNLVLKRDASTFTFRSGSFYFLAPVNGKVTGAVFMGEGTFALVPPLEMEKKTLKLLTKEDTMSEVFQGVVLRFTDGTYEEIKKAAGVTAGAPPSTAALSETQEALRKKMHWNLTARILEDVLSTEPGGLFVAFIKGTKYSGKMVFVIDPHGAPDVAPEEVALWTYDPEKGGIWAAFHYSGEYAAGQATGTQKNAVLHIERQQLDIQMEKSGRLSGTAITTFLAQAKGLRVVPFNLFPTLRVESVSDASGQALAFIQENKDEDPDFAVILPKALAAGERYALKTVYSGKDAVKNEGNGNYFPVARENWYPSSSFGDYAEYEMTFRVPKELTVVASGAPLRDTAEGNQQITEWKSEAPLAVGGFNLGQFKRLEDTLPDGFLVTSYANESLPDAWARSGIDTRPLIKKPMAEAHVAVQLYTNYFGAIPYKHLAMTQQTACNFGQAWPELVYLPICSYLDTTERHFMGLEDTRGYWKVVAPHEVAHQWWGHAVGFHSYRDQWMSEGFADFSASLFLQQVFGIKEFQQFWQDERSLLTEKNPEGHRPIDVGPLTQGYRLANSKSGFDIPRRLIYPKGAYILHMVRMMLWDSRTGDQRFKELMHDFAQTYANRAASTEDFKAMVEQHMIREMDLDGNGRMDWFFNEYVYGTALPTYKMEYTLDKAPDGSPVLNLKMTQSNVDSQFRMLVPVYLVFSSGKVSKLGSMRIVGNTSVQQQVPLAGMKETPARAVINYFADVLCASESK